MSGTSVFVVAGPTAVGKGTVEARLFELVPGLWMSVSVTTREPRPSEVDGVHYHFVSDERFDELIATDQLLEWAEIHGHRSGTPRLPLEDALAAGRRVLIEVDVQGARAVRGQLPDVVGIFIAPPSFDVLRQRLLSRGSEDPERQARRLARAEAEMAAVPEFDHVVVNDDVERAAREIAGIITASH